MRKLQTIADEKRSISAMVKFVILASLPFVAVVLWWIFQSSVDVVAQLKGKRVIVCGASTGIGEQIAYIYARGGARIVIAARRDNVLERVQAECVRLGAQQVERLPVDLSTSTASAELIRFAEEKLGGIDVLVLNHIVSYYQPWSASSDLERATKLITINTLSYVYLATHALPALERSHGTIAVVSSVAGKVPGHCQNIYSASKFALHGFFESLRIDLSLRPGGSNISISLIPLGLFGSDNAVHNVAQVERQRCLPKILQSFGDPTDAAMVIVRAAFFKTRETIYPWGMATVYYYIYTVCPSLTEAIQPWLLAADDWLTAAGLM